MSKANKNMLIGGSVILAVVALIALGPTLILSIVSSLEGEGTPNTTSSYLKDDRASNLTERTINRYQDDSTLEAFTSLESGFSASFPTYPTHEIDSETVYGNPIHYYSSEDSSGTSYLVMVTTYPDTVDTSVPMGNLEMNVNGMATASNGTVGSMTQTEIQGYPAVDFLIRSSGPNLLGRMVMVDHTVYEIVMAYSAGDFNQTLYNEFMGSFRIQ